MEYIYVGTDRWPRNRDRISGLGTPQSSHLDDYAALEVDPNQDNGLGWYAAIQRDGGGETSALDAFRRVAALPRSWRAQLWLARDALQGKDFPAAESLYTEALGRSERPVPTDLLMQMSGDLGNNGYLAEIIRLVEPCFDPAYGK